ncbi:succinate dehydrogenase cytochrome b558 subunit [Chlamydia sp. 17-3921]|uniref:succinate dehydrogenase cytochrome b558 subunit n=1 Tax=Chlamydia sp. 17-3921 TaxID=2675798 RepID=UPI00191ABA58|nr:succinate dehydrogenase cytochrome b558 subunit [Chlamydia sp. 17-3921]
MSQRGTCPNTTQKKRFYYFAFLLRCIHSLAGLAFTLFLCEHLLTNQLAASYLGWGKGFIAMVDQFHSIPGLKVIEIICLALPFISHAVIGIVYLFQGKSNFAAGDGRQPSLRFSRNYAYSWQRWTAWILLFGLIFHVVHLRFIRYPLHLNIYGQSYYVVNIDSSRYTKIVRGTQDFLVMNVSKADQTTPRVNKSELTKVDLSLLSDKQSYLFTTSAGKAFLYIVRDSLSSLWMAILYTVLVLAAAFHGFNGLWTFCSRWGIIISSRSQTRLRNLCYCIMVLVAAMGISVIWNLYSVA